MFFKEALKDLYTSKVWIILINLSNIIFFASEQENNNVLLIKNLSIYFTI